MKLLRKTGQSEIHIHLITDLQNTGSKQESELKDKADQSVTYTYGFYYNILNGRPCCCTVTNDDLRTLNSLLLKGNL